MTDIYTIYLGCFLISMIAGFINTYSEKIMNSITLISVGYIIGALMNGDTLSMAEYNVSNWHWMGTLSISALGYYLGVVLYKSLFGGKE